MSTKRFPQLFWRFGLYYIQLYCWHKIGIMAIAVTFRDKFSYWERFSVVVYYNNETVLWVISLQMRHIKREKLYRKHCELSNFRNGLSVSLLVRMCERKRENKQTQLSGFELSLLRQLLECVYLSANRFSMAWEKGIQVPFPFFVFAWHWKTDLNFAFCFSFSP